MKPKRATFKASDLVRVEYTGPTRCCGCLRDGYQHGGSRSAKCDRCGDWMVPVNVEKPLAN